MNVSHYLLSRRSPIQGTIKMKLGLGGSVKSNNVITPTDPYVYSSNNLTASHPSCLRYTSPETYMYIYTQYLGIFIHNI